MSVFLSLEAVDSDALNSDATNKTTQMWKDPH